MNKSIALLCLAASHFVALSATADEFMQGYQAAVEKRYQEAHNSLEKAARRGEPNALFLLGTLYHSGLGGNRDEETAVTLYHRAAERGHILAQEYLAAGYREGWFGLPKDASKAQYWSGRLEANPLRKRDSRELMLDLSHRGTFPATPPQQTTLGRLVAVYQKAAHNGVESAQQYLTTDHHEQYRQKQRWSAKWGWQNDRSRQPRTATDKAIGVYREAARQGQITARRYLSRDPRPVGLSWSKPYSKRETVSPESGLP